MSSAALAASFPLVSCVMPTADRIDFALQAVRYFERQDYPRRELVVVDDGERALADLLPASTRIRYRRLAARVSIGAKRNLACELAGGEIIAQWDDDDYYAPDRLSKQVAPILAGEAEVTGLEAIFFDLERWTFWHLGRELHRSMFVGDVHGGTLVFHRRIWGKAARYPHTSLAEDADFLRAATARGARLERLEQDVAKPVFLYLRHGANSWRLRCGRHLDAQGWMRLPEPALPAAISTPKAGGACRSPRCRPRTVRSTPPAPPPPRRQPSPPGNLGAGTRRGRWSRA